MLNFTHYNRFFITTITLCLMLTGCCSITEPMPQKPANQKISWITRQKSIENIRKWQAQGSVAINAKPPLKSFSASLNWRQNYSFYTMYLFGPLGFGTIKVYGEPGKFTLQTSANQIFSANTPEKLIKQQLGINIPVSYLYYWIRGLPVPTMHASKQFDSFHRLTRLIQEGWKVSYLSYTRAGNFDLPNKIFLANKLVNAKIIISRWKIY